MKYLDLKAQYDNISVEIDQSIKRIIESSAYIGGEELKLFSEEFKNIFGANYFLPVANGTDALFISLKASGIGHGDEVITTASSWISTAEVITLAGARPVFVDIDEFNTIDVDKIREKITDKTKALIPVHLYGQMCNMPEIIGIAKEHNLTVIEDCAQAHLSELSNIRSGLFGDFGTFSFYPGKNLGAYGDAGGIIIKSAEDFDYCKMFANHGMLAKRHVHHITGINSRLDGLQAAVLRVKLKYIKEWTENRVKIANQYYEGLKDIGDIGLPRVRPKSKHSFHIYAITTDRRDDLREFLKHHKIPTSIHYPTPIPLMPCYFDLGYQQRDIPCSFALSQTQISLPIYPEMTSSNVQKVIDTIKAFFIESTVNK